MRRTKLPPTVGSALVVPTVLALTALAPACGAGKDDTTAPPTSEPTDGTTQPTGPTTTTTTTTTGTTTATSTTTGGELPDCSLYSDDAIACSSMIACLYLANESACIVRCNNYTEQATCETATFCYWAEGGCYLAV
jgi:hypothetical protein